jgi:hypothetical protein
MEFNEVSRFSYNIFGFEMQTAVGSGRASEDAVDDASRADLVGRGCCTETEEGSGCENDRCEADHVD